MAAFVRVVCKARPGEVRGATIPVAGVLHQNDCAYFLCKISGNLLCEQREAGDDFEMVPSRPHAVFLRDKCILCTYQDVDC